MAVETKVEEFSPDPKEGVEEFKPEGTSEPGEVEEEEIPEYVCGILIYQLPDGQALFLEPIDGPHVSRRPTIDDLISIAAHFSGHVNGVAQASKVMDVLVNAGIVQKPRNSKGRIIH